MKEPLRFVGIEGCWSPVPFKAGYFPIGEGAVVLADGHGVYNPTTGLFVWTTEILDAGSILAALVREGRITRLNHGQLIMPEHASLPLYAVLLTQEANAIIGTFTLPETPNDGGLYIGSASGPSVFNTPIFAEVCIFKSLAAKQTWGARVITEALIPKILAAPSSAAARELLRLGFALNARDPRCAAFRVRHRHSGVSHERSWDVHRHWASNASDPWTAEECATFDRIVAGGPVDYRRDD